MIAEDFEDIFWNKPQPTATKQQKGEGENQPYIELFIEGYVKHLLPVVKKTMTETEAGYVYHLEQDIEKIQTATEYTIYDIYSFCNCREKETKKDKVVKRIQAGNCEEQITLCRKCWCRKGYTVTIPANTQREAMEKYEKLLVETLKELVNFGEEDIYLKGFKNPRYREWLIECFRKEYFHWEQYASKLQLSVNKCINIPNLTEIAPTTTAKDMVKQMCGGRYRSRIEDSIDGYIVTETSSRCTKCGFESHYSAYGQTENVFKQYLDLVGEALE